MHWPVLLIAPTQGQALFNYSLPGCEQAEYPTRTESDRQSQLYSWGMSEREGASPLDPSSNNNSADWPKAPGNTEHVKLEGREVLRGDKEVQPRVKVMDGNSAILTTAPEPCHKTTHCDSKPVSAREEMDAISSYAPGGT
ncbi:hypothetical protein NDU88_001311 [Pleurodeles waltl]|uniref:Prolactin receptor n=1 Tax=Pleurodeles waltl TaxID=8319 RepID=A0AAV7NAD7_PLEWA|nr:hypothetical protein NDU88_001311 [Pleurodeles waltl]